MEERMIKISLQRYEELVQLEANVNSVVELIRSDEFTSKGTILRILGTVTSVELSESLRRKDEERRAKDLAKYSGMADDAQV